jgi:glucan phosphoethanolaminetransferase (alkaline phosphatase superfamily)
VTPSRSSAVLFLIVALAASLHMYQFVAVFEGMAPLAVLAFWAWSLVPYIACLLVAWVSVSSVPACVGAFLALCFDIAMHITVVTSTSSTRGLGFMFMPLWNLVLIAPLAMFLTWLAVRKRNVGTDAQAHTLQENSCLTTSYSESATMQRAKRSSSRHSNRSA